MMGLGELIVDVFEECFEVFTKVNCLSEEFLADPLTVLGDFDAVVLVDVSVNQGCSGARLKFINEHPEL